MTKHFFKSFNLLKKYFKIHDLNIMTVKINESLNISDILTYL